MFRPNKLLQNHIHVSKCIHSCKHSNVRAHKHAQLNTFWCIPLLMHKQASTHTHTHTHMHAATHTLLGNQGDRCPQFQWFHRHAVAAEHREPGRPLVNCCCWVSGSGCSGCLTGPWSWLDYPKHSEEETNMKTNKYQIVPPFQWHTCNFEHLRFSEPKCP